ncbi:aminotransferase [Crucibulum laeve]|uniref:Aminotransferase n=1 Tax=Crucibulum laeve TaxID=68775 RepID=A0A5C3M979_9AGAR|nr:aminotransferase [Crucibulum laeve]
MSSIHDEASTHDDHPSCADYQLLTTTRYDNVLSSLRWNNDSDGPSPFLLLPYHFHRLISAAEEHGWIAAKNALNYSALKLKCQDAVSADSEDSFLKAFRMRICVSYEGAVDVSITPASSLLTDPTAASFYNPTTDDNTSLYGPVVTVRIDTQSTSPSIFTSTKTTKRTVYDDARSRNGIPPLSNPQGRASDVLLYNSENMVTETTIFNFALYRSSHWITPSAKTGCLPGVVRRWLLEQGRIQEDREGLLTKDSIKPGEWVLLFNGAQGCRLGQIA